MHTVDKYVEYGLFLCKALYLLDYAMWVRCSFIVGTMLFSATNRRILLGTFEVWSLGNQERKQQDL
jgi:hypothetical protein